MDLAYKDLQSYQILDTEKQGVFDEITEMAAEICDCAVSLIVLLEPERQWFKSAFGLDVRETPIKYSICKKLKEENLNFLVIPDLKEDPELKNHPALEEFGVQFYAGFPLKSESGNTIGTCCVLDYSPKHLDDFQLKNLRLLAKQANNLLDIHKSNYQIKKEKQQIEKWQKRVYDIAKIAKVGGIVLDYNDETVTIGDHTKDLLQLPQDFVFTFPSSKNLSKTISNPLEEMVSEVKGQISLIGQKEGSIKYYSKHNKRTYNLDYLDSNNTLIIVFKDITITKELQSDLLLYQSLMKEMEKQSTIGAWEVNLEENKIFWTQNTYRIYGLDNRHELSLDFVKSFYPKESYDQMERDFEECINSGKPYENNYRFLSNDHQNKWVKVIGNPIKVEGKTIKIIGSIQDITEDMKVKNMLERNNFLLEKRTQFLEGLVNNNSFFIFRMSTEKEVIFINEYYKHFFGFDESYGFGKAADISVIDQPGLLESEKIAKKAIENPGKIFRSILKQYTKKGEEKFCEWDVVFMGEKSSEGLLWIGHDVTDKVFQQNELNRVLRLTSVLNAKLVEFNNITSHLFRSQIANLTGLYQLIELSDSQKEKQGFLDSFKICLDKVNEVISDLDAITNLESPGIYDIEPINLDYFINDIIKTNFPYFKYSINNLKISIPEDFLILTTKDYLKLTLNQIFSFIHKNRQKNIPFHMEIIAYQEKSINAIIEIKVKLDRELKGIETYNLSDFPELESWKLRSSATLLELIKGSIQVINTTNSGTSFKIILPNAS
ncbi:PAS domain S-box protein [Algoriphagus formosus]|uniref:PAS domain S-box protein n=1 Tax=Algoriphagus formosus TaxID=2007308 RepID=UPI000C291B17|nr:PAS domain S-box protein [Algoriphagus formosus]